MEPAPSKKAQFPGWLPRTLTLLRYFVALAVAIALAAPSTSVLQFLEYFLGCLAVVWFIPYLVSFIVWREFRFILHTVGVVVLGGLITLVLLEVRLSNHAMEKTVLDMTQQLKSEQRDNVPVEASQIEARMQQLKTMAGQTNTPEGSILSAVASLGLELMEKVKASQAAEEAAGDYEPAQLTNRDEIEAQIRAISELRTKQADALDYLQNFYTHIREVLTKSGIGKDDIDDLITRTRQGRDLSPFINALQLKIQISDDRLAQLKLLDKNWGHWQVKNGAILFSDAKAQDAFNTLATTLQADMIQIESPQK